MKVVTKYPDGVFSWVDLQTTDPDAAKRFYGGLFGWSYTDMPIDSNSVYTMVQIEGKNVAGLSGMGPGMENAPPHWGSYVNHSDIDSVAAKVAGAGGTLLMPPMDVMETGRMAMIQDPTGAVVGVWQPKAHTGAELVNMPNTLVWNELQTRDGAAAKAFYMSVFGWEEQLDDSGYVLFKADGRVQAGMMQTDDSWGDVPPHWSVYFMVEDVDASAEKAKALGGTQLVPVTTAGEMGRFSVIQDPQGAVFTIMQFSGPVDAPPGH